MEKQYKVELKGKLSTNTYSLEKAEVLARLLKTTLNLEDSDVVIVKADKYNKRGNK